MIKVKSGILKMIFCMLLLNITIYRDCFATEAPPPPMIPASPPAYLIFQLYGYMNCNGSISAQASYPITPPPLVNLDCPSPYQLKIIPIPLTFWNNTTLLVGPFKLTNGMVYGSVECYGHDSTHQSTNQENFYLLFYCVK